MSPREDRAWLRNWKRRGYEGVRKRLGIPAPVSAAAPRRSSELFTDLPFDL